MTITTKDLGIAAAFAFAGIAIAHDIVRGEKVNTVLAKVGKSIDGIEKNTVVEIQEDVVNHAVEAAAKKKADKMVGDVADKIVKAVAAEMQAKVTQIVEEAYIDVKDDVKKGLEKEVNRISVAGMDRIKREIVDAAVRKATEKIDDDLSEAIEDAKDEIEDAVKELKDEAKEQIEEVTRKHDEQLEDVAKIYGNVRRVLGDK